MNDVRGKELFIDDLVAYATYGYTTILVGRIERFTPKMVVVKTKSKVKEFFRIHRKYSYDLVKIDSGGSNDG